MFGRRAELAPDTFVRKDPTMEQYVLNKQVRLREIQQDAEKEKEIARERAKKYFDKAHITRSFEKGDLVMARKMGRIGKLSNRWEGPYIVKKRVDDIYSILCQSTNKKIERHVSDLKMYK